MASSKRERRNLFVSGRDGNKATTQIEAPAWPKVKNVCPGHLFDRLDEFLGNAGRVEQVAILTGVSVTRVSA